MAGDEAYKALHHTEASQIARDIFTPTSSTAPPGEATPSRGRFRWLFGSFCPQKSNPTRTPTSSSTPQPPAACSFDHGQSRHCQAPPASPCRQSDARHDGTPWHLWTKSRAGKKEGTISHASLSATLAESRRHNVDSKLRDRPHTDIERKAWMQSDKNNSAWVLACPRGVLFLNARQFPVVTHAFFGVKQRCLEGLVG